MTYLIDIWKRGINIGVKTELYGANGFNIIQNIAQNGSWKEN